MKRFLPLVTRDTFFKHKVGSKVVAKRNLWTSQTLNGMKRCNSDFVDGMLTIQ